MNKKIIFILFIILVLWCYIVFGNELKTKTIFEDDNLYKPKRINLHNKKVYILDTADQSIKVYDNKDNKRRMIKTFGSKGEGPRELVKATDFVIYEEKLYVLDAGNQKIEIFSLTDGNYVKQHRLEVVGAIKMAITNGKLYIASITMGEPKKIIHCYQMDDKMKAIYSFLYSNRTSGDYHEVYSNLGLMTAGNGKIYFTFVLSNQIYEFSEEGKTLKSYTLPFKSITKPELEEKNNHLTIKRALNYDIKLNGNDVYVLSRNENQHSVISKLVDGKFIKTYLIKERIRNFDIWENELWAINEDIEVLIYNIEKNHSNP